MPSIKHYDTDLSSTVFSIRDSGHELEEKTYIDLNRENAAILYHEVSGQDQNIFSSHFCTVWQGWTSFSRIKQFMQETDLVFPL